MWAKGLLLLGMALPGIAAADKAEAAPASEFLEYLGLWEADDEEWLFLGDLGEQQDEVQSDKAADSEIAPEKKE